MKKQRKTSRFVKRARLLGGVSLVFIVSTVSFTKSYISMKQELQSTKSQVASLEKTVDNMDQQLSSKEDEISSLSTACSEYLDSISSYEQQVKDVTKKVKKLEKNYDKQLQEFQAYEAHRKISVVGEYSYQPSKETFMYMSLKTKSLTTADEMNQFLEGTGLEGLGYYYKYLEATEGINAVALMSISILESNWGKSPIAVDKNNILSWTAYDDSPYSSATYFNSKADCLVQCTPTLCKNYLETDGKYYHGTTLNAVNVNYSSSDSWASQVAQLMLQYDEATRTK